MTEASAVMILMPPESQYIGIHMVQISITWETPQATMKIAKLRNIQVKPNSARFRTKYTRVKEIVKYESAIKESAPTWTARIAGRHR